jgi:hypothetical protein
MVYKRAPKDQDVSFEIKIEVQGKDLWEVLLMAGDVVVYSFDVYVIENTDTTEKSRGKFVAHANCIKGTTTFAFGDTVDEAIAASISEFFKEMSTEE